MTLESRLPILWLTIRQLRAGKATRVVGLFALAPVLFGLIHVLGSNEAPARSFLAQLFLELLAPTVVPLATLVLATNVLGNEVADRTLAYLVLKPVSRGRIVVEKYLGALLMGAVAFAIGLTLTWLILVGAPVGADWRTLEALVAGTTAAIAVYGALFLLVSLVVPRALMVGIIYVLLWESTLARLIPGIRLLSVRHFSQSIFVGVLRDSAIGLPDVTALPSALLVLVLLTFVSLVLASVRLRAMNLN